MTPPRGRRHQSAAIIRSSDLRFPPEVVESDHELLDGDAFKKGMTQEEQSREASNNRGADAKKRIMTRRGYMQKLLGFSFLLPSPRTSFAPPPPRTSSALPTAAAQPSPSDQRWRPSAHPPPAPYGVAPPARPDLPHGSAPLPSLAYIAAPPPALSGQFVVAPPPAPTLPVDPLLLRGAFDAPVYGAPAYWWRSSAGQQVFPAGHPAYPTPQSQAGLLPIASGEYPPPLPSGGYGLPMASPSPSPSLALPPAPWDPVLLPHCMPLLRRTTTPEVPPAVPPATGDAGSSTPLPGCSRASLGPPLALRRAPACGASYSRGVGPPDVGARGPPAPPAPAPPSAPPAPAAPSAPPVPLAPPAPAVPPAPMAGPVTRARTGVFRPSSRYASDDYVHAESTSEPSRLPSSVRAALHDPLWMAAMQEEFDALLRNRTWQLVPVPGTPT
nr:vegetative cell wall protein gp1-like [Aegilops tauschii subsp. strangulata]